MPHTTYLLDVKVWLRSMERNEERRTEVRKEGRRKKRVAFVRMKVMGAVISGTTEMRETGGDREGNRETEIQKRSI